MVLNLISVGAEILMGNIVNTNAAFLARECVNLGMSSYHQTVVGDNAKRLAEVYREALKEADVIILTGGLGPTEDDLTKETVAEVLGLELVNDEAALENIRNIFASRGMELTQNNYKQAMVPVGCTVLYNANGTAPGLIIEKDNIVTVLLPGPPHEMKPMFLNQVVPYLEKLTDGVLYSATIKECGIGESILETKLMDLIDGQTNPTMATYAKTSTSEIRLTAKAPSRESARNLVKPYIKEIKKRLGEAVYATVDSDEMEDAVCKLLKKYNLKITTAESCTGGLVSAKLVNVPGISDHYEQGFIAYSVKAKNKLLGVNKECIKKHSSISREVAAEMAKGALNESGADVAISVTGYAGPDDTEKEPKGLVYIGIAMKDDVTVQEFHFNGDRNKIRESAAVNALNQARLAILHRYEE